MENIRFDPTTIRQQNLIVVIEKEVLFTYFPKAEAFIKSSLVQPYIFRRVLLYSFNLIGWMKFSGWAVWNMSVGLSGHKEIARHLRLWNTTD